MERKNIVRLTESQLHNIIAESVKKALNELDARTYANYARKREEQGQHEKAEAGRKAAIDAWNRKYRKSTTTNNQPLGGGKYWCRNTDVEMNDFYEPEEHIHTYFEDGTGRRIYNRNTYNPVNRKYTVVSNLDVNGKHVDTQKHSYNDDVDMNDPNPIRAERNRVAREMATGTGTYIPGKGWQ